MFKPCGELPVALFDVQTSRRATGRLLQTFFLQNELPVATLSGKSSTRRQRRCKNRSFKPRGGLPVAWFDVQTLRRATGRLLQTFFLQNELPVATLSGKSSTRRQRRCKNRSFKPRGGLPVAYFDVQTLIGATGSLVGTFRLCSCHLRHPGRDGGDSHAQRASTYPLPCTWKVQNA